MVTLLEKIENLLNNNIGDISRLEHIKKSIAENKKIYNSDIQYVEELEIKRIESITKNPTEHHSDDVSILCWNCEKVLVQSSKFCSFCGVRQDHKESKFIQGLSRIRQENNPLKIVSNFHSYQILAIIGGFAGVLPILIAISNIGRILEIINFYTSKDLSGFVDWFIVFGVISTGLCFFAVIVSFAIKKSKRVGRILFFLSFTILVFSIMVGVAGFVFILFAAITALKKRRY